MKEFLTAIFSNPRLWQVLLVSILTFLGYSEAVRIIEAPVSAPVGPEPVEIRTRYVPVKHDHKDWLPVIRRELEKARDQHNDNHHGGS